MKYLVLMSLVLGLVAAPMAQAAREPEVDYLDLAALMLRDGNYDRALAALDQVDTADGNLDRARYYTLRGMAHLRRDELEPAREALQQAVAAGKADGGEADGVVHVYLAQIHFRLQDYAATLAALDRAGTSVERIASIYHMRAQCHWLLEDPVLALATLDQAAEIFVQDHSFLRRKIFFLIDLGLFHQAAALGREYLAASDGALDDYLALGTALRASGDADQAAVLLEQAVLGFPDSAEARKVLAHAYLERGELTAAADLLYVAALLDGALLGEAAELYRRAGQTQRALWINGQLTDQPAKLRQRLAIYLQLGSFEQAVAMQDALKRIGLLDDEDIRYAIAYALFKTGDFNTAETQLATLNRPDLFRKAAELRRAIQDCAGDRWKCL
jgi:Flp pilus assembly protein TadD